MTDSQIEQREAEWEAEYKKLYSAAEATGFDYINGIWYEDWASDMATLKVWGSYEARGKRAQRRLLWLAVRNQVSIPQGRLCGPPSRKQPMKTVRIQVLVPEDWRDAYVKQAAKSDQGLSEWLAELGKYALPKTVQGKLSERKGPGQPRKES